MKLCRTLLGSDSSSAGTESAETSGSDDSLIRLGVDGLFPEEHINYYIIKISDS